MKPVLWMRCLLLSALMALVSCGGGGGGAASMTTAPVDLPVLVTTTTTASRTAALPPISAPIVSDDVLVWADTQLAAEEFVGINGQYRDSAGQWQRVRMATDVSDLNGPTTLMYQPFRSKVNREAKQIYWRKDESRNLANSWYGEIWNYDAQGVYIHSETFPSMYEGQAWDQRIERFRLFQNQNDPSKGRQLSPRTVDPSWVAQQTTQTLMCGVSQVTPGFTKTDGFLQVNSGACVPYQSGVQDARMTAKIEYNWSVYEPGMSQDPSAVQLGPDSAYVRRLPAVWDAVLIISQYMAYNGGYSRERFIMGYHQGQYYGMIAWDDSWGPTFDSQTVNNRAVPEAVLKRVSAPMDYDGMLKRSELDRTLPAPAPKNLRTSCVANSTSMLLEWDRVPGAYTSMLRIDDLSTPWVGAGDQIVDWHKANSFIFDVQPGRSYNWWVHGYNEGGWGDPTGHTDALNCAVSGPAVVPVVPAGLSVTMSGDLAILNWTPTAGATSYNVRIDDLSDAWLPGSGNSDVVLNNHKGASLIFKVVPGKTYRWWVHAVNTAGESVNTFGPNFQYTAP